MQALDVPSLTKHIMIKLQYLISFEHKQATNTFNNGLFF